MGYKYTLTVNNHSTYASYFILFQKNSSGANSLSLPLAWFSKFSNPSATSRVRFQWTLDWGLSWAETGELRPGVSFFASQVYDLSQGNKATLDYNGAYEFKEFAKGPEPNQIYLAESANIPVNSKAAIGVTLSGSTVFAVQAQPNMMLSFSPQVNYYLAYGNHEEGEVIDVNTLSNPLHLVYETGVYAQEVTLNMDNSWSAAISLAEANTQR